MPTEKKQNKNNKTHQSNKKPQTNPPTMFHFIQMGKKKIKQTFILETLSINLILVGRWQGKKKDIRKYVLIKNSGNFLWCCKRWQVTPE